MKIKFTEFSLDLIYPESPPRFHPSVNIHNNSLFRSLKRSTHAEHRTCVLDSRYSGALTSSSTKPKGGHSCQKHPCTLFNLCFLLFPSAPPSWRARFIKTHLHKSNWHARTHTHTVYWTLRARADTPWCQSLSSLYLGPITNWVVVLFSLTPQDKREER